MSSLSLDPSTPASNYDSPFSTGSLDYSAMKPTPVGPASDNHSVADDEQLVHQAAIVFLNTLTISYPAILDGNDKAPQ